VNVVDQLGVNRSALDATLLLGYLHEGFFHFHCYGDGVLIFKYKHGTSFIQLSYAQNAPYYLTVHSDEKIKSQWKEVYPDNGLSIRTYQFNSESDEIEQSGTLYHRGFISTLNLEHVMFTSDGIGSFCHVADGAMIPAQDVIRQMFDIKVKNGEYIKRRMKKMLEGFARDGIYPLDDVSVSSMIFEEKDGEGAENGQDREETN
jgi:hypothetical protein